MDRKISGSENEHIGQGVIKQILHQRFPFRLSGQLQRHLKTCEICRSLVKIVQRAKSVKGDASFPSYTPGLSKLELTDLVVRSYDKSLSPKEAALFLHALVSTDKSFDDLVAVLGEAVRPVPETTQTAVTQLAGISIAEKALEMIPSEETSPKKSVFDISAIWERISVPSLTYAAVAVTVMAVGWSVFDYFNTDYKIAQASEMLVENYRVYYKDMPRLSGNYGATATGAVLGERERAPERKAIPDSGEPQRESSSMLRRDGKYLKDALKLTEEAIANGARSPEAKRLQAQIYIIEGEFKKAEERLNSIPADKRTAAVFNDLGVLNFKQGDLQKASDHFETAIQVDRTFKEAYYNLALVQKKRGLKREVEATIREYLKLETNEDWHRAARALIK